VAAAAVAVGAAGATPTATAAECCWSAKLQGVRGGWLRSVSGGGSLSGYMRCVAVADCVLAGSATSLSSGDVASVAGVAALGVAAAACLVATAAYEARAAAAISPGPPPTASAQPSWRFPSSSEGLSPPGCPCLAAAAGGVGAAFGGVDASASAAGAEDGSGVAVAGGSQVELSTKLERRGCHPTPSDEMGLISG
jgi:hypothetical protein